MKHKENDSGEVKFRPEKLLEKSSIVYYHRESGDQYSYIDISPNVSRLLGYSRAEIKAEDFSWLSRIHPEDRQSVISILENIDPGHPQIIEYRFKHKSGHYLWLRDEFERVANAEKEELVGVFVKANKSKEIQYLNLEEREKLQQLALDNLNDMVVITRAPKDDPLNSRIVFVNKSFEQFTGYQSEEIINKTPTFLHGPQTSEEALSRINQKIKKRESLREEFINYKKDGTPYWVELDMAPFPTDDAEYEFWVGINRDITKRKIAEKKLAESEKRHRTFTEMAFDAIFEIHVDGTILRCNKRACELFGYSREELIGMHVLDLTPEEFHSKQPETFADITTTGDEAWERIYQKKDGMKFPTEIHTAFYEMGGQKRLIAYVRDITDHKKYEQTIRKSLKEKETLLSEVHHRVKNNLAIISGLLQMQVFNTEDENLLAKLKESQSRIQSIAMVHEKLYSSETFSEIAIDKYINDLLNMIEESMTDFKKDIRVNTDMESIRLTVGQAIPCGLLLNEMITNCYKHAFKNSDEGEINISVREEEGQVKLSVEDNGIGLPEDFSIEQQPSLGMTIINTLTTQLDGQLKVDSGDFGSRFSLAFDIEGDTVE
ncbi:PAS domain S-box protein [Fodinibius sp.]|uniref:PAS domain S-box protein n=1 Tax=Fodinibius sp. TaxID=1872440 RepID=UPI002ACE4218|nr:PAS domain S-box protein [Fodinibius sp.]MDZ7659045.1 PAS domain S-box protein [Fodinibius sp.]